MSGNNHVLELDQILEDDRAFYVVMPRCKGGELFDFLVNETEVSEKECRRIVTEILTAVGHLHDNQLVHRDVKPENIMFSEEEWPESIGPSPKTVKLIDFDTCMEWTPTSPKGMRFVGTPGYIAPEALLGEITPQSDLFSIGVIFYILFTGCAPFRKLTSLEDGTVGSAASTRMYNAIKEEDVDWDMEPWPDFPNARDLCQQLLAFDLKDRPLSVQEVFQHPWMKGIELTPEKKTGNDFRCHNFIDYNEASGNEEAVQSAVQMKQESIGVEVMGKS
jgi:calcium/calmodulin-dependent protein kinase-4